ncbi:Uncharacterized conserved protein, DUF885 familyt [Sphingobium sp. AP50]|uniref:DUF885 domain-containing protein n=1 Tax=Sphingobium sp. AP50 TaxID=1884369 RepID=UPI0008D24322|nr:DUF885 domain-containing protein [Sphingobium sp. AP50]SEJ73935.1 Uncharacterized conserved protein, DUF885 familyt [Sphingobium sp. AP50]
MVLIRRAVKFSRTAWRANALAMTLATAAHGSSALARPHEDLRLNALIEARWTADMAVDPTARTEATLSASEAEWTPVTDVWRAQDARKAGFALKRLEKTIDPAKLSLPMRIRRDIYKRALETRILRERVMRNGFTIGSSIFEPVTEGPRLMARNQKIASVRDAENYLARIAALPALLDSIAGQGEERAARGVVLTQAGYKAAAAQSRTLGEGGSCAGQGENAIEADFRKKIASAAMTEEARKALSARMAQLLSSCVCPAYGSYAARIERLAPKGRSSGMWQMAKGAQAYEDFIELALAERISPDAIFARGEQEIERVERELRAMASRMGFADLEALRQHLRSELRLSVPNSDAGYALVEAKAKNDLARVEALLPQYFLYLPKSPLAIRRGLEGPLGGPPTPSAFYIPAAADGSRPATYSVGFAGAARIDSWNLSSITFHEALPGHHLQFATAQELRDGPDKTGSGLLPSYIEGWGLYAEQLAYEMGLYANDDYGKVAWMQFRLERAVRLVLDTALNYRGWSYEQGAAYQKAHLTTDLTVNRFVNWPGQALGYYWGYLEILALRDEASRILGPQFDIRGFHDAILRPGPMPPVAMRRAVKGWIVQVKAGREGTAQLGDKK